jgi:hypothetical protein
MTSLRFGLLIFVWAVTLLPQNSWARSEEAAVTDAFYGVSKLARKSLQLSVEQADRLDSQKRQVLREMALAGAMPSLIIDAALGANALTGKNLSETLAHLERAPLLVCESPDQCACPAEAPYACSQSREFGEGISLVTLIDPCLLSQNPGINCEKAQSIRAKKNLKGDLNAVRAAMSHALYRLAQTKASTQTVEALVGRLRTLLSDMSEVQRQLQASCGKRFPWPASQLLMKSGHLSEIENPYVRECGRTMVGALFSAGKTWETLPPDCKKIIDQKRYLAWAPMKAPTMVRCDALCSELTCRDQRVSGDMARPLWLGKDPYLDLPQASCEGPTPRDLAGFVSQSLFPYLVKREYASSLSGVAVAQCIKSLGLSSGPRTSTMDTLPASKKEWESPIMDLNGGE